MKNKKGGAGKGNWGNHNDDLNTDIKEAQAAHEHVEATSKVSIVEAPSEQPTTTAAATTPATTPAAPITTPVVENAPVTVANPPPVTEKEDEKSISYAEWLKKSEKTEVPLPRSLRTAGEGIDDTSGWAKIEVTRTEDKPVVVAAKKEDKKEKQPTKEKKEEKKENKKPATAAVPLDKVFNLTVKVEEKEERNFKKGPRGDKEKGKGRGRGKRAGAGVSSPNRIQNANKKPEEFNLANDAFPSLSPTQAKHVEVTSTPQVTPATTQPQQTTTTPPNPST